MIRCFNRQLKTTSPPVHFTGDPGVDWAIFIAVVLVGLYILKAIRLSREAIRPLLRLFLGGFLIGIVYYLARGQAGGDRPMGDGVFFGFVAVVLLNRKRSRYIPKKLKREIIARNFKGREHEYNPKKHHIDHKWPFARGGSHTRDNLRVMERGKNLRKGAKRPGLWDMFFR